MAYIAYLIASVMLLIVLLLANGVYSSFSKNRRKGFISSTVLFALIASVSVYMLVSGGSAILLNVVRIYPFSLLFVALFAVAMALVNALSYSNSNDYHDISLFVALVFLGAFIVATAISIIAILIGLELIAITTSFMILLEGKHRIEAAVKFFILSSVSVAVFTFALAMLLPYSPQLSLVPAVQNQNISGTAIILFSIALFIAAFGFDTALFPFNLWIPDVYEGAPTYATSMLAGINKKVAFVALIEVFFFVFLAYRSTFTLIFAVLAILTMFFGNIIALVQANVKRMFAYSSISQAGYILVGIASATQFGLEASIFYIIAHAFMIIGAFAIVMWLESRNIKTISDYTALDSRNRFAAVSLTILMLSMAGIPPLMGFTGKFLLFSSAISTSMVLLAVFGIINSFISIYYYAKVINSMYSKRQERPLRMGSYIAAVVIVSLIIVIAFGIYPQPLIAIASKAASSVLGI